MYHHSLMFIIVSKNDKIREVLQEMEPLEDCSYVFRQAEKLSDVAIDGEKPDVAFVYDTISGVEFLTGAYNREENILVAAGSSPLLRDAGKVALASEIWVMPKEGEYDYGLLQVYFQRLAERMKKSADSRKQKICFETLLNSVPDIAWFKDVYGAHLIVNDSFCGLVEKTKEQIYKKGHCYIWNASKEDEEVCLKSDRIIMDSRGTNTFEESVKVKNDMRLLKSYKSALVDTDGEIFGTCGIAHDVTVLRNMSTELDMVLDSVPFAMIVENRHGIVINKNTQFDKHFPEFANIVGRPSAEWRFSLVRKILLEESIKEVVVQSGEEEQVLVFDEEPILDNFGKSIGKITTLTDITLERSIYKKSEHLANTDDLTGLNNRRSLMKHLKKECTMEETTLIMVDLDNFKQVNDTLGHEAGDKVLIATAEKLRECFPEDFVARMGGDEFMIIVSGKSQDKAKENTERWLEMMRNAYRQQKEFNGVTASAGIVSVALLSGKENSISGMLQAVDEQLYKAKNSGKNRCCIYGEDADI